MANAVIEKLDVAKIVPQLQGEFENRRDELLGRGQRIRSEVDRRRQVALGRLRDQSYRRFYEAGERVLQNTGEALARLQEVSPIKLEVVGARSEQFQQCAKSFARQRTRVDSPSVPDYDELNVSQVKDALEGLSFYELQKLRVYEEANKNRVTVLRAVDRILEG